MYIATKNFRGLQGLGRGPGLQQIPLANSKYGLYLQTFPGIQELQQYGGAEEQEAQAGKINASIRQEIQSSLSQAQSNGWSTVAAEIQAVWAELSALKQQGDSLSPFKEAPQVPGHRMAQDLVKQAISKAPPPSAAPAPVSQPSYSAPTSTSPVGIPIPIVVPSVATDVASSIISPPSPEETYSYEEPAAATDQKKVLMYGGLAIIAVIALAVLLRKRTTVVMAPAARRRKRRHKK